jgi:hypothetical protein
MSENVRYGGHTVTVGTCENLWELRWDQVRLVTAVPGNYDPVARRDLLFYRFPWPDEDHVPPGEFADPYRGHRIEIPGCPCCRCGDPVLLLAQQKWHGDLLVPVLTCDRCGSRSWPDSLADAGRIAARLYRQGQQPGIADDASVGLFKAADRLLEGLHPDAVAIAAAGLPARGFQVIPTVARAGRQECDVVARAADGAIVFLTVKAAVADVAFRVAFDLVDRGRLTRMAIAWRRGHQPRGPWQPRIGMALVLLDEGTTCVTCTEARPGRTSQ